MWAALQQAGGGTWGGCVYDVEWLTKVKADVIFAFYGFNESFKGDAGLEKFRTDLDKFVKDAKAKTGTITLKGPAGDDVFVDGEDMGKTPLADAIPLEHALQLFGRDFRCQAEGEQASGRRPANEVKPASQRRPQLLLQVLQHRCRV